MRKIFIYSSLLNKIHNDVIQSVQYHIRLSSSFNAKIRTYHIFCMQIFKLAFYNFENGLFLLNFLISPENRNLELLTIQYRHFSVEKTIFLNVVLLITINEFLY